MPKHLQLLSAHDLRIKHLSFVVYGRERYRFDLVAISLHYTSRQVLSRPALHDEDELVAFAVRPAKDGVVKPVPVLLENPRVQGIYVVLDNVVKQE